MKRMKKILSTILALTMVMSMNLMVSAAGSTPTVATHSTTEAGITDITVNGTEAYYETDSNGSTSYIRAKLPDGSKWSDLQNAEIVVNVADSATKVSGTDITFTQSGTKATATADLLNKAYNVTIGSKDYVLAAGFDGKIALETDDAAGVTSFALSQYVVSDVDIYGTVVQADCMGNAYYDSQTTKRTDPNVSYYITGTVEGSIASKNAVKATLGLKSGASVSGCASASGSSYILNLTSSDPVMKVTNGSTEKSYHIFLTETGVETITVDYGFDFGELEDYKDKDFYSGVKAKADEIAADATIYFNGADESHGTIEVPKGSTVMDVLEMFTNQMGYEDATEGSTYTESINGLAAFDGGSMSGWMYSDSAEGWSKSCNIPMVGGADYVLTDGARITWFYTCDYTIYWH